MAYGVMASLPLEDELRRRRASQAGALQADLAGMGVPGQMPPGGGGGGGGAQPPMGGPPPGGSRLGALMQERRQQAGQLQERSQDLQVGERLLQLLDPRLPRPARQFLFRELSRQMGVDPQGQRSKEIGTMLTSLDPQSLENARRALASQVTSAGPGEITQLTRGILSGQVPVTRLLSMTASPAPGGGEGGSQTSGAAPPSEGAVSAPAPGGGSQTGGSAPFPGIMRLGAGGLPPSSVGATGSVVTPVQSGTVLPPPSLTPPPPGLPGTQPPVQTSPPSAPAPTIVPEQQHVPPRLQEIAPELAEVLGLDNSRRYRNIDVIRGGFTRIPTTPEDQRKMVTDIRSLQDGMISTLLTGGQLYRLIDGHPEALNLNLGRVPRLGEITAPNLASTLAQLGALWNGAARTMGWDGTRVGEDQGMMDRIAGHLDRITRSLTANMPIQETANLNARIQALVVNLAFSMAAAQGQTGRNLSDRDLELQMQALGRSANPEQFQAALAETLDRIYAQYRTRTTTMLGQEIPLNHILTPETAQALAGVGSTPRSLQELLGTTPPPSGQASTPPAPAPNARLSAYDEPPGPEGSGGAQPLPPSNQTSPVQFLQSLPQNDQFTDLVGQFQGGMWRFVNRDGQMFTANSADPNEMSRIQAQLGGQGRLRIFQIGQGTPESTATLPTGSQVISQDIWQGLYPQSSDVSTFTPAGGSQGPSVTPGSGSLASLLDAARTLGGAQPQTGQSNPTSPAVGFGQLPGQPQPMTGSVSGGLNPVTPSPTTTTSPPSAPVTRPRRLLDVMSPSIESEEQAARARLAEDRAEQLAERARAARQAQLAEEANQRAARSEARQIEEQRRQHIRDAFAQIAQAMRAGGSGGISMGSGGGAGLDQDPRAFQLAPPPQRRPPTPVNAAQFQRQR